MIISGGVNIYPQEAENLLISHPLVVDAAVFGVPDDVMGQSVKAVVQLADPARACDGLADELIAWLETAWLTTNVRGRSPSRRNFRAPTPESCTSSS